MQADVMGSFEVFTFYLLLFESRSTPHAGFWHDQMDGLSIMTSDRNYIFAIWLLVLWGLTCLIKALKLTQMMMDDSNWLGKKVSFQPSVAVQNQ